jgi:uncharacterized protein YjiS (DUF1127 family)
MTLTETKIKHWRLKFLDSLRLHGIVTQAAKDAGIDRDTAYYERQRDPVFAAEWKEALDRGVDMLEDVAKQRAYAGSDTLLIFLLKAHRPVVYRETIRTVTLNITPDDLRNLSDDDLDNLESQLKAADRH